MNFKSILLTGLLAGLFIALKSDIDGPAHHGHGDITGATTGNLGHCQVGTCHGGNNVGTLVQLQVIDTATMLPITQYTAWHTYMVKITGNATAIATNLSGYGFQTSAVTNNHKLAGSYTIPGTESHNIHTYACGNTTVVEQSNTLSQDTAGVNKYTITFYWTAPTYMSDTVTFYTLLNAVNGDGGKTGDYPNTAPKVILTENPADSAFTSVTNVAITAGNFNVYPNPGTGSPAVSYSLYAPGVVSLSVYDMAGRKVAQPADNELQAAGDHEYHPTVTAPGLYFITLVTGSGAQSLRYVKL